MSVLSSLLFPFESVYIPIDLPLIGSGSSFTRKVFLCA